MTDVKKTALEMSDDEINMAIRLANEKEFGALSSSFLSKSIGSLNPRSPLCVHEDTLMTDVITLLQKNSVGSVLITHEGGKLAGIFTERDCLTKVIGKNLDQGKTKIRDVMTPDPETQELDGTIAFALNLMSLGGFRHIPIVDQDRFPIGIISVKDVVDYLVHSVNSDLMEIAEEE